jgi:hypothetical protein
LFFFLETGIRKRCLGGSSFKRCFGYDACHSGEGTSRNRRTCCIGSPRSAAKE